MRLLTYLSRGIPLLILGLVSVACREGIQSPIVIHQQEIAALITVLHDASMAASFAEPALENTLEPDTSDPLYIESLRQYRNSSPTEIEIVRLVSATEHFARYEIRYHSEGWAVSGLMNVPISHAPNLADDRANHAPPSRLPVILLNHGHYDPNDYRPGLGTEHEAAFLAERGYVTISSDYRGYGQSEGKPGNHFDPGWTHDVLNLLDSLDDLDFVDTERIGLWGHSTGGEIALQVVTSRPNIDAIVLFAALGADTADNLPLVQRENRYQEEIAIQRYGRPEEAPDSWAKLSPITYLADAAGPIAIHHGGWDEEVPFEFSARLWAAMKATDVPGEYYFYPDQHHFFTGADWTLAMERTLAFFNLYVKKIF